MLIFALPISVCEEARAQHMKVEQPNGDGVSGLQRVNVTAPAAGNGRTPAACGGGDSDQVDLSSLSRNLQQARYTGEIMSARFAQKVAELSAAVAGGHYQVSSAIVSSKIIEAHLQPA
jgi:flagellar biosynthesis anti-sigma factor FlgM